MSNKTPKAPEFTDAMRRFADDLRYNLYCHLPGEIISFDRTKGTAKVQPALLRVFPDYTVPSGQRTAPYKPLEDVPVFVLQGGGASLGADPVPGDPCLLAVADRNLDAWLAQGGQPAPLSPRAHDLSDCLAFVGFNPVSRPLSARSARRAGEAGISDALAKIVVKNGLVNISNGPAPVNSLGGILDIFFTATAAATSVAQVAAAAAIAKASLATLMPNPFP